MKSRPHQCKCYKCRKWTLISNTTTWWFDHDNDGWTKGRFCNLCRPDDPEATKDFGTEWNKRMTELGAEKGNLEDLENI